MKTLLVGVLSLQFVSCVYAVTSEEIQAGYAELNRACGQFKGRSVSHECIAAGQRVQSNADRQDREIYNSMQQRNEERRRIQQEELWREQVRRGYR
ncbi:hypothetical protein [Dechloromonas sp. H13]|uniref:hypothetical protein n=1 Tax=Dechloromonas sp. H13 TaxID=2570193 RepID=UPI001291B62A|nr:hypothetical protein [Dechloromonas sp. H13]